MITEWEILHPSADLEFLGNFLSTGKPDSAAKQIHEAYSYGGGWSPMDGWEMVGDALHYPGDPPLKPIAKTRLRDEEVFLYPSDWVCIRQPDGSFEVARVD